MNWPNESAKYREAREKLLQAEVELRRLEESVAAQRRALPAGRRGDRRLCLRLADRAEADRGALRHRQGHALPLQLHVPPDSTTGTPIGSPVPGVHLDHRRDGRRVPPPPRPRRRRDRRQGAARPVRARGGRSVAGGSRRSTRRPARPGTTTTTPSRTNAGSSRSPTSSPARARRCATAGAPSSSGAESKAGRAPAPRRLLPWPLWKVLDLIPAGRGTDWHPQYSYSDT